MTDGYTSVMCTASTSASIAPIEAFTPNRCTAYPTLRKPSEFRTHFTRFLYLLFESIGLADNKFWIVVFETLTISNQAHAKLPSVIAAFLSPNT